MPKHPTYRFPGIIDFIPKGACKASFEAKIPGLYFVGRVVDALSQMPEADEQHRQGMLEVADEAILGLQAALDTVMAARAQVVAECMPEATADEPKKEPADKKKVSK